MSIYDKASLVLIPSGTNTSKVYSQKPVNGDGDFTFSRSTAATRVNADGNIEKETENKVLLSNTFSSATWNKLNASVTSGQSGYDNTNDAWLLSNTSAGAHISQPQTSDAGQVITISVYAKAGTLNWLRITEYAGSNVWFDLGNGVVAGTTTGSNFIASSITDVGNGWYRCTSTTIGGNNSFRFYPATDYNDESSLGNIYIQDAQRELGLVARDYIETTTAAVEGGITDNVPRLDYTDSSCPALLLEPQRTNLVDQSEYFSDNSNWFRYNLGAGSLPIVTDNYGESPEGLQNAARLQLDAGGISSSDRSRLYTTIATTNGTNYTWSFYAKSNTGNNEYIKPRAADVNYSEITITTEWQRFDVSFTANATGTFQYGFECRGNHTENSVDILIYGAQVEAGSYATSYIPTYGTSVTRDGEVCDGAGNASTFNDSEGVLYAEIAALANDNTNRGISISDGTPQNRITFLLSSISNTIRVFGVTANGLQFNLQSSSFDTLNYNKIAVLYQLNNFKFFINGTQIGSSTSGAVPIGLNSIAFDNGSGGLNFYGKVNQVLVLPTALSDAELETLTTI